MNNKIILATRQAKQLQVKTTSNEPFLPIFTPAKRRAILINSYDLDYYRVAEATGRSSGYSPYQTVGCRGNNHIYSMEAILSGHIALQDPHGLFPQGSHNLNILASTVTMSHNFELEAAQSTRKSMLYDETFKIMPNEDMQSKFSSLCHELSLTTSDNDLTFIYLYAHAQASSFELNLNEKIQYTEFLNKLSMIQGKKAIIFCGCYSGNLINHVQKLPPKQSKNYCIISSTLPNELSWKWNDGRVAK